MIMFRLTGVNKDGEAWGSMLFDSREKAEAQKLVEEKAYTHDGVLDWVFTITPEQVQ